MKAGDRLLSPCTVHIPDYFEKMNEEMLSMNRSEHLSWDMQDRILYHDEHIIVVNKPRNALCQVAFFRGTAIICLD